MSPPSAFVRWICRKRQKVRLKAKLVYGHTESSAKGRGAQEGFISPARCSRKKLPSREFFATMGTKLCPGGKLSPRGQTRGNPLDFSPNLWYLIGMNRSDQQLIADYLAGDEKSLEILYGRYLKPIYSFVYRYVGGGQDVEDVTQDAFVKVWRNLKKFDQNKSFKTWIFSIAKNTAIDFLKKKKTIPFSEFENEYGENMITETLADPSPLPHELLEKAGMAQILNSAMEKLSPKYRMVLFLRYNDHFNFREIAESLGEPLHTITSRHRRALIKLKELIT